MALRRLLDITPASSLSFVLDTTGSMGEEITAAKIQARHISEQRRGGPMEPAHYVLVPFHDPGGRSGGRVEGKKAAKVCRGQGACAYREQSPLRPLLPKGSRSQRFPSIHA